jgi:hypothetical protein
MKVLAFFHRFKRNATVLSHFTFYYFIIIIIIIIIIIMSVVLMTSCLIMI